MNLITATQGPYCLETSRDLGYLEAWLTLDRDGECTTLVYYSEADGELVIRRHPARFMPWPIRYQGTLVSLLEGITGWAWEFRLRPSPALISDVHNLKLPCRTHPERW